MIRFCIFLIGLALYSCEYFNVKKISPEAILNEELRTFNWDEVDAYPSFTACDSFSSKQDQKQCFERILTKHIMTNLQQELIVVTQDINDTMILQFQVSETGNLSLQGVQMDSITSREIPNIKDLLFRSLDSLPEIFPAVKRRQKVKSEFKLPIIIQVN
ncbi:hypothetical protein [Aestuariivivens sediminis]|uniref:hypothetical protein n=1 Tax=Aestuariivivens sediminis TaxID=2913557 RepID=UPI001F593ABC|nr:hypothetical protein [Aestuariivivens sediminis]